MKRTEFMHLVTKQVRMKVEKNQENSEKRPLKAFKINKDRHNRKQRKRLLEFTSPNGLRNGHQRFLNPSIHDKLYFYFMASLVCFPGNERYTC